MAVIFKKEQADQTIEVRKAGNSIRLYSNGVLHSQYNPNRIISGAIWDLLVLPGFFLLQPPKRVLVLGLGGGSVVHLIQHFFPDAVIYCIEREAIHIQIAKRYFGIPKAVKIIKGDAYEEMSKLNIQFDWILDDVFQHVTGEPERDVPFENVYALYKRVLSTKGVLSMNTIGKQQLKELELIKNTFACSYLFRHPLYENTIVSFYNKGRTKKEFFDEIIKFKELDLGRKTCRLDVNMRKF